MRIGLDQHGNKLYRVAEVVSVEERQPAYMLGSKRTMKQLLLDFGEIKCATSLHAHACTSARPPCAVY